MKNISYLLVLLLAGCVSPSPQKPTTPPQPVPRAIVPPPIPGRTNAEAPMMMFRAASAPATIREASFTPASILTNRVRKPLPPIRKLTSINLSTTNGSYRIEHSPEIANAVWTPFIFTGGWPGVSIIEQSGSPYGFYRAVNSSNPSNAPVILP